jgi:glycosyltransferase involved in cell wall biosynthesis
LKTANRLRDVLSEAPTGKTIVHLHGWHRSLSSAVAAVIRRKGFPLICTMHDYFLACPNGGFYNFQTHQPCPLKALSPACLAEHCDPTVYRNKLWRYGRTVVQKYLAKLPNQQMAFISVSDFSHKIIAPYLPPESTIYDLTNPVSIPWSPKIDVAQNQGFAYLGRLTLEKGVLLLAEANSDQNFQLTFIGAGNQKESIQALAPSAKFTGWLNWEGITSELSRARALIFPTMSYETQGMAVLEAASIGIPAVISNSSAATSWVRDGINGLWFQQGDPEDLRRKMQMMEDDDLLSRLGAAAYEQFWQHPHSPEQHIDKLIKIYQTVLNQENKP